jgi:hypothetical protein
MFGPYKIRQELFIQTKDNGDAIIDKNAKFYYC